MRYIKILCILLIFSGLFLSDITSAKSSRVAIVQNIQGEVYIKKGGGSKEFKAVNGMGLTQGDFVRTKGKSSANLVYEDGTKSVISPNSQVMISKLSKDGDGKDTKLKVWSGKLWNSVKNIMNTNDTYDVETPTAVMGVRGTHFLVETDPITGNTRVIVLEGKVGIDLNREQDVKRTTDNGNVFDQRFSGFTAINEQVDILAGGMQAPEKKVIDTKELVETVDLDLIVTIVNDLTSAIKENSEQARSLKEESEKTNKQELIRKSVELIKIAKAIADTQEKILLEISRSDMKDEFEAILENRYQKDLQILIEENKKIQKELMTLENDILTEAKKAGIIDEEIQNIEQKIPLAQFTESDNTSNDNNNNQSGGGGNDGNDGGITIYPLGQPIPVQFNTPLHFTSGIGVNLKTTPIPSNTTLTVNKVTANPDTLTSNFTVAGAVVDFQFNNSLTFVPGELPVIQLPINPGMENAEVGVFFLNEQTNQWEYQPTVVSNGFAIATVSHFSTYGVFTAEKTEMPQASVPSGSIKSGEPISLQQSGGDIYYTLDGTYPTVLNGQKYTNPIVASGSEIILRAIALAPNHFPSDMVEYTYTVYNSNIMTTEFGVAFTIDSNKVYQFPNWTEFSFSNSLSGETATVTKYVYDSSIVTNDVYSLPINEQMSFVTSPIQLGMNSDHADGAIQVKLPVLSGIQDLSGSAVYTWDGINNQLEQQSTSIETSNNETFLTSNVSFTTGDSIVFVGLKGEYQPPIEDQTGPVITSLSPANNELDVELDSNLSIYFDENVQAVSGKYITIFDSTDNSVFEKIEATATEVSINNNVVTINPVNDFEFGKKYYVKIDGGAFTDTSENKNPFNGIVDNSTWSFTSIYDSSVPIIELNGDEVIYVLVGSTFTDPGASATDSVDGDLTSSIVTGGSVDTAIPGTYTLTYNVSDSAGNAAPEVTRTVHVIDISRSGIDGMGTEIPLVGYEFTFDIYIGDKDYNEVYGLPDSLFGFSATGVDGNPATGTLSLVSIDEIEEYGYSVYRVKATYDAPETVDLTVFVAGQEIEDSWYLKNLTFSEATSVSGVVKLPPGITAPSGGLDIEVVSDASDGQFRPMKIASKEVTIPEGQDSVSYELPLVANQDNYISYNLPSYTGFEFKKQHIFTNPLNYSENTPGTFDVILKQLDEVQNGITTPSNDHINLSWEFDPNIEEYYVYVNDNRVYDTTTESNYTVLNLTPNTEYEIRIEGYASDGGEGTELVSVIQLTETTTNLPTLTNIKKELSSTSVALSWDPVQDATRYDVIVNGGTPIPVNNSEYILENQAPMTPYSIQVMAINNGTIEASSLIGGTTLKALGGGIQLNTGYQYSGKGETYIDLKFKHDYSAGYDIFKIRYGTNGQLANEINFDPSMTDGSGFAFYKLEQLIPNTEYTISIIAYSQIDINYLNPKGESTIKVSTDPITPPSIETYSTISGDHKEITLYLSEGIYTNSDGTGGVTKDDFIVNFNQNGGTATGATIVGVTKYYSADSPIGGEDTLRIQLDITGTPSGVETLSISPKSNEIYDGIGTAMLDTEKTNDFTLN